MTLLKKDAPGDELLFVPLGGAGEIGMNLNVYGSKGCWLAVDAGVTFADDTTPPGIDLIMPDPAFLEERRDALCALVLTHAHEDHLGAVPYLWPRLRCPVYATPFAAAVLRRKLDEAGLSGQVPLHELPLEASFSSGPFSLRFISLTHSIPEPNALVIDTPQGRILHTGDWKLDPEPLIGEAVDEQALSRLGDEGVLAMVCDSTNVFVEGWTRSEGEVRESLVQEVAKHRGRVAVTCFASNVARVESIVLAARAVGREVCLVGRSLQRMVEAARECGYIPQLPHLVSEAEAADLPPERILYICTGSQGEPRAALARIASGNHGGVSLGEGDVVLFSSRVIPGNERAIGRLKNNLARLGVTVIGDGDEAFLHVSGHPARDELKHLYGLVRPRIAVPVHGERRHLEEHARLALDMGIAQAVVVENGDVLRLSPGPAMPVDAVETGRLVLDGTMLVRLDSELMQSRKRVMHNGSAVVTVVMDRKGRMLRPPQVSAAGLLDPEAMAETCDAVVKAVQDAVETLDSAARGDDGLVREAARLAVRRSLRASHKKKPVTEVHLVRV